MKTCYNFYSKLQICIFLFETIWKIFFIHLHFFVVNYMKVFSINKEILSNTIKTFLNFLEWIFFKYIKVLLHYMYILIDFHWNCRITLKLRTWYNFYSKSKYGLFYRIFVYISFITPFLTQLCCKPFYKSSHTRHY